MTKPQYQNEMQKEVAKKERRKIRARESRGRSIWFGLGMFGLIGWSIAIPTLIGASVGLWMDRTWEHSYSCTLMGLFAGITSGCWIAWYWIQQELFTNEQDTEDDQKVQK